MNVTRITMMNAPCDRCGQEAHELRPFKLSSSILYRRRVIEFPWLCTLCFVKEKEKWWANLPRKSGKEAQDVP